MCTMWLVGKKKKPADGTDILEVFIGSSGGLGTEEGCQWIKDVFSLTDPPVLQACLDNAKAFKWVISSFNITPNDIDLFKVLRSENIELLQWLPTLFQNSDTTTVGEASAIRRPCSHDIFIQACSNPEDPVSLVKTLLPCGTTTHTTTNASL
ncbi:hypothetical protein Pelo_13619 [Pelomyxa schiedti]|nr:hypothetical protein Pelo_13619 [Pelomyxa schiedti]